MNKLEWELWTWLLDAFLEAENTDKTGFAYVRAVELRDKLLDIKYACTPASDSLPVDNGIIKDAKGD